MKGDGQILAEKAKEIEEQLQSGSEFIPLDKPDERSERKSNKGSGLSKKEPEHETSSDIDGDDSPSASYNSSQSLPFLGGYKLSDILEAPLRPPKPVATEDVSETSDRRVILLIVIGTIIVSLSIYCLIVDEIKLGIAFLVLGAVVVMTAVFAPIP